MPPRVSVTLTASLFLLASLLPGDSLRHVEASAVATDDACFYDVASGQCVASAVWVTGQHGLLRTPRANLLADVAAGIETCASAFGDEETCVAHVGTCEYDAGFFPNADGGLESVGGCFPTLSWAAALLERCLADVSDADAVMSSMLATAAKCVAHTMETPGDTTGRESCERDKKCAWTETDANGDVVPGFCAPDPLPLAVTALGASGVGALVAAKTACEEISLETPCDSDPNCEWRSAARRRRRGRSLPDEDDNDEDDDDDDDEDDSSHDSSDSCAANVPHVLLDAVTSPAIKAYLSSLERCAAGRESASACLSLDPAGRECAWGKKRTSTNVIPEAYDGDGGDGSGGWFTPGTEGTEGTSGSGSDGSGSISGDVSDMSCFPTYASIGDAVAPTLGIDAGACGSLAPLFDAAENCAAAGSDRAKCDAVGACSYAAPDTASTSGGRCEMDASAAMEALMSGGDAAVIRAINAKCAEGDGNTTACKSAGAEAATAGMEAAGERDDDDGASSGGASTETSALSSFVLFCFFFFALVVAPPVAYANYLKNRGEDVCDRLPPWLRPYVPAVLRPQISQYESFVGQETGDDL